MSAPVTPNHPAPSKETCYAIYSTSINCDRSVGEILREDFPQFAAWDKELKRLFKRFAKAKQRQNVLDYDHLLLYWAEMLEVPEVAAAIAKRFKHILVDEYQDTNRLQARIIQKMKPNGAGVVVVGDDAQSIYSFRGAAVRNILEFPHQFDPPARVVTLEQNYRSTQPILNASNAVINLAAERFTKNLFSDRPSEQKPLFSTVVGENEQARHVAQDILDARERGVPLNDQAVLFRSSHHSAALEVELRSRDIPFRKVGGIEFLEAHHVKDVISVLRWCQNPKDKVAAFRTCSCFPASVPPSLRRSISRRRAGCGPGRP